MWLVNRGVVDVFDISLLLSGLVRQSHQCLGGELMQDREPVKGNVVCPECGMVLEFLLEYTHGLPTGTVPHMYSDGWKDTVFCDSCSVEIFIKADVRRIFEQCTVGSDGMDCAVHISVENKVKK